MTRSAELACGRPYHRFLQNALKKYKIYSAAEPTLLGGLSNDLTLPLFAEALCARPDYPGGSTWRAASFLSDLRRYPPNLASGDRFFSKHPREFEPAEL
jgi:hypothetical protein